MNHAEDLVIATTTSWLDKFVIGLNLCPFAKAVHAKKQIRFFVSAAIQRDKLLCDLKRELSLLANADPEQIESTLLIHPEVLNDFAEFNDFLAVCDLAVLELELDGVVQVASFHPDYVFAGTKYNDVSNYSNRSPFPTLHLLREESVACAVETFPDAAAIYERNIATLKKLGATKLRSLFASLMDGDAGPNGG